MTYSKRSITSSFMLRTNITGNSLHFESSDIQVGGFLYITLLTSLFASVTLIADHPNSKWREMRIDPFALFQSITSSDTDNDLKKIGLLQFIGHVAIMLPVGTK